MAIMPTPGIESRTSIAPPCIAGMASAPVLNDTSFASMPFLANMPRCCATQASVCAAIRNVPTRSGIMACPEQVRTTSPMPRTTAATQRIFRAIALLRRGRSALVAAMATRPFRYLRSRLMWDPPLRGSASSQFGAGATQAASDVASSPGSRHRLFPPDLRRRGDPQRVRPPGVLVAPPPPGDDRDVRPEQTFRRAVHCFDDEAVLPAIEHDAVEQPDVGPHPQPA